MKCAEKSIKDLCTFSSGHGFTRRDWAESGLPIIRIAHLNGERKFDYFNGTPEPQWLIQPGDLLFAWAGTRGVSFGPTIWRGPKGVLNQHIYRVTPKHNVEAEWLYYALSLVTRRIERRAHGFKSTLLHVRKSDIENQRCIVPPIAQQRTIASAMSLAESLVEKTKGLIEAKREFKRGLTRQLLTGGIRFPQFEVIPWRTSTLSAHVHRITRKNSGGCQLVLTASGEHGLVDQRRFFNRNVASADLSKYYLLRNGEFAYNRSAMSGYPYGATKRLDEHEEGALSTLYLCFGISDVNLQSDFLKHVFDSGILNRQLRPIVRVGARAHGLLNVTDDDFLAISIPFPKPEEQRRVAEFLSGLDQEIDLLEEQNELSSRYKHGLLQRLMSGDVQGVT